MTKKLTRNERRLAKKEAKAKKPKRIPRQNPLPGMEDTKLAAIENAALDYAEIRDQRQALTTKEVACKKKLLDLMHRNEKTEYKRNGISVIVQMEEETVKVRVRSEEDLPVDESQAEVVISGEAAEG